MKATRAEVRRVKATEEVADSVAALATLVDDLRKTVNRIERKVNALAKSQPEADAEPESEEGEGE